MTMKILLPFLLISPVFASEELLEVEVSNSTPDISMARHTTDTASLLDMRPGVSIRTGGGLSSQPALHGMSNDRVNIRIDDVLITSACSNHMNPALSYIDPAKVEFIETMAGITPVSYGGDSLGGSILVKSKTPVFSDSDSIYRKLTTNTYYRSNNDNTGASLEGTVASKNLSFQYAAMDEKALRYRNGDGDRLKGTIYNQNNQSAKLAARLGEGVVSLKLSRAIVPYQGFVNQYMDLNDNKADAVNLSYTGELQEVLIETNLSHQNTQHYMDKLTSERSGKMPMYTNSDEFGYNLKATHKLDAIHTLKVGGEYNQFRLEDWWEPVTGSMGMSPGNYKSIHNGSRDRWGIFSEVSSEWSQRLSSLIGIRMDQVRMDTGDVVGYNNTINLPADAAAFNNLSHTKQDENWDATISGRYILNHQSEIELGYARKTRSPNLYERYAWAGAVTNPAASAPARMDMRMINWFGDGNGYVGDIDLKPEVAHTLSSTLKLKNTAKSWEVILTPYFTYVEDFIDADLLASPSADGRNYLKFANHDAIIMGGDLSGSVKLNSSFQMNAVANYNRGYRQDGKTSLYHMMPLHGKIQFEHLSDKWSNQLTLHLVNEKKQVNTMRKEPETAGYALLDIGTAYQLTKKAKIELAVLNLLDKQYALPLGGIDVVNFTPQSYTALSGMGRSINTNLSLDF